MKVGDKVMDNLTGETCTIIEVINDNSYIIDNDYFGGYRSEWGLEVKG